MRFGQSAPALFALTLLCSQRWSVRAEEFDQPPSPNDDPEENARKIALVLEQADANKDGRLDYEEISRHMNIPVWWVGVANACTQRTHPRPYQLIMHPLCSQYLVHTVSDTMPTIAP